MRYKRQLVHSGRALNWYSHNEKNMEISQKIKNRSSTRSNSSAS